MIIKEPDIFKVEREFPFLNDLEINNVKIWPFLRNHVRFELLALPTVGVESGETDIVADQPVPLSLPFFEKLHLWYITKRELLRVSQRVLALTRNPQFILISNRLEKKNFEGQIIDKLCTGLIEELGDKRFVLMEDGALQHLQDFKHKNIPLIESSDVDRMIQGSPDIPLAFTRGSLDQLNDVLVKLGVKKISITFFDYLFKRISVIKKMFSKYKPKAFFSTCYTYYADIYAAKSCGITTVELQHGIISENHPAYYSPLKLDRCFTADYIFAFGADSFTSYKNCVYSADKVYAVGNYYLELLNEQKLSNEIKRSRFSKFPINVCVPTDYVSERELIEFLHGVASALPDVGFHLNPREALQPGTSELIAGLPNISVVTDMPFQELVRYSDFNTSTDSTCCLEALNLGVPNILYNIGNKAYSFFHNRVDPRFTKFVLDPENYILAVREGFSGSREEVRRSTDSTFRIGYRKNILEAINEMAAARISN